MRLLHPLVEPELPEGVLFGRIVFRFGRFLVQCPDWQEVRERGVGFRPFPLVPWVGVLGDVADVGEPVPRPVRVVHDPDALVVLAGCRAGCARGCPPRRRRPLRTNLCHSVAPERVDSEYGHAVLDQLAQAVASDEPKITDWLSVVVAFLALAAAAWAAWTSHRTSVSQSRQLREAQEHDLRRQAAQIVAWAETYISDDVINDDLRKVLRVSVLNTSRLPVFNVEVSVDGTDFRSLQTALPPSDQGLIEIPFPEHDDRELWEVRVARMVFTDAEGNRWRRDAAGLTLLARARTAP